MRKFLVVSSAVTECTKRCDARVQLLLWLFFGERCCYLRVVAAKIPLNKALTSLRELSGVIYLIAY